MKEDQEETGIQPPVQSLTAPYAVSVHWAVYVLNRALEADSDAVSKLVSYRVGCNEALARDPTVQVGHSNPADPNAALVGMLGIINGIFGADPATGWGFIAADIEDGTRRVKCFRAVRRDPDTGKLRPLEGTPIQGPA